MVGVYLNVSIFGIIEMYTIALNFVSQSSNDLTGVLKLSNGWNLDMYVFFSRQIINGEEKWKVNIFRRNTTQVMVVAFVLSSIFKCREKQQKKNEDSFTTREFIIKFSYLLGSTRGLDTTNERTKFPYVIKFFY